MKPGTLGIATLLFALVLAISCGGPSEPEKPAADAQTDKPVAGDSAKPASVSFARVVQPEGSVTRLIEA